MNQTSQPAPGHVRGKAAADGILSGGGQLRRYATKDNVAEVEAVLWGIPKGHNKPVVLVTAYRPDPARWDKSFTRRQ